MRYKICIIRNACIKEEKCNKMLITKCELQLYQKGSILKKKILNILQLEHYKYIILSAWSLKRCQ